MSEPKFPYHPDPTHPVNLLVKIANEGLPPHLCPGGPPAPGHRTLNAILRDTIRAGREDPSRLPALRAEYDAAAGALFALLAEGAM